MYKNPEISVVSITIRVAGIRIMFGACIIIRAMRAICRAVLTLLMRDGLITKVHF